MGEPTEDSGIDAAVAMWDAARPVREPADEVVMEGGPAAGLVLTWEPALNRIVVPGSAPILSIPEQEAAGLFMVPSHDPRWNAYRTPDVTYADTGRRTPDGRRVFAPEA